MTRKTRKPFDPFAAGEAIRREDAEIVEAIRRRVEQGGDPAQVLLDVEAILRRHFNR